MPPNAALPYSEDEMLKGFKDFILRGNVVDLAVAVVIGAAFGAIVTKLVADLITPLIAAIGGKPNFANLSFTVHKSRFLYGDFINALISFVIIAAAIYFLVVLPLNKLAERRARQLSTGAEEPEAKAEDVLLLEEIRDLLAAQGGSGTPSPRPRP
jgi:large conductance mechanosensitive channel